MAVTRLALVPSHSRTRRILRSFSKMSRPDPADADQSILAGEPLQLGLRDAAWVDARQIGCEATGDEHLPKSGTSVGRVAHVFGQARPAFMRESHPDMGIGQQILVPVAAPAEAGQAVDRLAARGGV